MNRVQDHRQPRPLGTLVGRFTLHGRVISAIARLWMPGDTGRCKLCVQCRASRGLCLVVVGARVENSEAPLFDTSSLRCQGGEGPGLRLLGGQG